MRKVTICFLMPVRSSERPSARTEPPPPRSDFYYTDISIFSKIFTENSAKDSRYFIWRPMYIYNSISIASA